MLVHDAVLILRHMAGGEDRAWTAPELAQAVNTSEEGVLDVMLYLCAPQVVFNGIPLPLLDASVMECLPNPTRFVLDVPRETALGFATELETREQ